MTSNKFTGKTERAGGKKTWKWYSLYNPVPGREEREKLPEKLQIKRCLIR